MQPRQGSELESRYPRTSLFYRKDLADEIDRLGLHDPARWGRSWSVVRRRRAGKNRPRATRSRLPWILTADAKRPGGTVLARPVPGDREARRQPGGSIEVARRGIATPPPVALLAVEGPRGLYRGWLATEEVDRARDLGSLLSSPTLPVRCAMRAVSRCVATHARCRGSSTEISTWGTWWRGPRSPGTGRYSSSISTVPPSTPDLSDSVLGRRRSAGSSVPTPAGSEGVPSAPADPRSGTRSTQAPTRSWPAASSAACRSGERCWHFTASAGEPPAARGAAEGMKGE